MSNTGNTSIDTITEQSSHYHHLEKMTVNEILSNINTEDSTVPEAVRKVIPQIESLVSTVTVKMKAGGRLFYIGAGTSGRLGVLDAAECPPTFGVPANWVIGIIAGGKKALSKAVEFAEDDTKQGWKDLKKYKVNKKDLVLGIASSGSTPYVVGALQKCKKKGIATGSIICNPGAQISGIVDYPIEVIVGPEFVTGSTRMKSGTAQKLVLNMISTAVMIQMGRVEDNKMVNLALSNKKLINRAVKMIMEKTGIPHETARELILKHGNVKEAINNFKL
jgi:N-acetylmuramic acid 6-phosphate etherase